MKALKQLLAMLAFTALRPLGWLSNDMSKGAVIWASVAVRIALFHSKVLKRIAKWAGHTDGQEIEA